jgi:hypothetical protein
MIIWLASYPKSGNTMVRSMLSAYFFSRDGNFNFDVINKIQQFPLNPLFERLGINTNNEKEVVKNYIKVQESINKKNHIQFIKTHSYLFNIDNNAFTDLNNSLGVIYIVRDPRTVAISYSHHINKDIQFTKNHLINGWKIGGHKESNNIADQTIVYTGNWANNYNSWKSFKSPNKYLLIRYEDLINDREKIFTQILDFIFFLKKKKFVIDKQKFKKVLETTSFDRMQYLEKKEGFVESKENKFFNLGPKNHWKGKLDIDIQKEIENSFKKEMIELKYL